MASISKERLREMEEEMDRFEAEIQAPGQPPGVGFILGASTFDQVQAQLSSLRQESARRQQQQQRRRGDSSSDEEPADEDFRLLPRRPLDMGRHPDHGRVGVDGRNGAAVGLKVGQKRPHEPEEDIDGKEFFDIDERPGRPQGPPIAPPPPPPPPPPSMSAKAPTSQTPGAIPLSTVLAPPPPPPPGVPPSQVESTLSFEPYGPGEGPPRPAFMPPQLRHRMPLRPPPGHRPPFPRPPMGGPPGSFGRPPGPPGPPGPYMGGPPMGPGPNIPPVGPPMNMGPMPMQPVQIGPRIPHAGDASGMGPYVGPVIEDPNKTSPLVEQPKVVYSAAPVISVERKKDDKKSKKKKKKQKEGESAGGTEGSSIAGSGLSSATSSVVPSTEEDTSVTDMEIVPESSMTGGIMTAGMVVGQMVPVAGGKKEKKKKEKKFVRLAASTVWEDPTLSDWAQDDFRIFAGDLGNEVTDETLVRAFNRYPSFLKAKVIRDRRSNKSKGYGFVSFKDPMDFARAMREMNGKYVGNRPIKLRKSTWKDRNIEVVKKKEKEKKKLGLK